MHNIKNSIIKYMLIITSVIMVFLLIVATILQVTNERRKVREEASAMFYQIKQVLAENSREIVELQNEYRRTCLSNAKSIAYMLQYNPSAMDSVKELKALAEMVEVDEIHIFDANGKIIKGTHPQYYGMTFDSGNQMRFFKPMLKNKSLELCQEVTPNTAEAKLMQYSAVWSENETFILQIGMEPVNVMRLAKRNEISHVFTMLRAGAGISLYAIDAQTGTVAGAADQDDVGKSMDSLGFTVKDVPSHQYAVSRRIKGIYSYCIFSRVGDEIIGYVVPNRILYERVIRNLIILGVAILFVSVILVNSVMGYISRHIIRSIHDINKVLAEISDGNLEKTVNINGSIEFYELSSHINDMIRTLLANTDKISYILNTTNVPIGVYEYNTGMKTVRFTEFLPEILGLDEDATRHLTSDYRMFREYIDRLRHNPLPGEEGIYCLEGDEKKYLKFDEVVREHDAFGIVVDMTKELVTRRRIESERDVDHLTGLLNRRGA